MGASIRNELRLYRRLYGHARPYRPHLGALLLLSLLATPIALLTPLPLKITVDSLTGADAVPSFLRAVLPESAASSQTAVLALAVGLVLAVALLDQLQRVAIAVLGAYAGERVLLDFRRRIFHHVQRLSFSYHDTRGTADSVFRINWDAAAIQWIAVHGFPPLLSAACLLVGMVAVVAVIDWQLTLVALAVVPLILLLTTLARRLRRRGWQWTKDLESAGYGVVQEVLTGLRVVKAFGQEDREEDADVKTYPVKGKVLFQGGKPVPDGRVQFQSTTDPRVRAVGDIDKEGSFTLTTHVEGKTARGATAGTHAVTVELERPAAVVALPKPLTVKPEENDLTIEIPARQR